MQSMTGYGKAEYSQNGITLTVEIKTVNNRFLDIIPKYPRAFVSLDDLIRKTVQRKIKRGRVELFVTYQNVNESGKTLVVDKSLADQYVKLAQDFASDYSLPNDFSVTFLMRSPDVVTEQMAVSDDDDFLTEVLEQTLVGALDKLIEMRAVEGDKLEKDLLSRACTVEQLVGEIERRAPSIKDEYQTRLKAKMEEILGDVKFDETRLLQEVAIFADKSNIDEEITRLKSHVAQLRDICNKGVDVGKKLDFLMQEFNRETNTVCSKSNDLEITRLGLALKNEIEKMREQVQNIE
ncbi:MAG: YicC family protein [Clostridia bacterium]|nr:YicC family protein [Clostridia bacterium]